MKTSPPTRTKSNRPPRRRALRLALPAVFLAVLGASLAANACFVYTDPSRIVTLEFRGESLALLNVINLADTAMVLEPASVLVISTGGQAVPGQVFAGKNETGGTVFTASALVQPKSAFGTDLWGAFEFQQNVLKAYFALGGRYLELASLPGGQFDALLERLENIDLKSPNVEQMFKTLQIPDLGVRLPFEETDSLREVHERCFTAEGINPPKIIRRPQPRLTPEAEKAGFTGTIKAVATLSTTGNVTGIKLDPEPAYGLGPRIIETIRNAWRFLPATYNGEVVPTEIRFSLQYGDERGAGKTQTP